MKTILTNHSLNCTLVQIYMDTRSPRCGTAGLQIAPSACSSQPSLPALFRRAAGFVPSGVAILSGAGVSMTVSSLCCVSWEPPLITVSLDRTSRKGAALLRSKSFQARMLRDEEKHLVKDAQSSMDRPGLVSLDCEIRHIHPAGDHQLVVAEVTSVKLSDGRPLLYWRRGFHSCRPEYEFLASRETFDAFVAAWENCKLPADRWSHAAHVAVAACYAVGDPEMALKHTRCGIVRYNESVGTANTDTSGYHETLTCLWAGIVKRFVEGLADPYIAAIYAVDKFGEDRDLHCLYYSFDVVRDAVARRSWIAPDLEGPYQF